MSRTFKYRLHGESTKSCRGCLKGTPGQAAKKALSSLVKESGKKTGNYKIIITETTQGSAKKEYGYNCKRWKLKEPYQREIGSGSNKKVIEFKYDSKVTSNKNLL